MKKLIILGGVKGVGKTHFAKEFIKDNEYIYVDYDGLFTKHKKDFQATLKDFIAFANSCEEDIILDGWFDSKNLDLLQERDREFWLIYANPNICLSRFLQRVKINSTDYTIEIIKKDIETVLKRGYNKIFLYNGETPEELKPEEFKKMLEDEEKKKFLALVEGIKENFPKEFYHGYQLPHGLQVDGLKTKGGEFITDYTLRNLIKYIDFSNKSLLDLGCYSGYFCFKAKELNAKYVCGIDCYQKILDLAAKIKKAYGYDVNFVNADIEKATWGDYDIILILSVLQHVDAPFWILKKAFLHSKIVVIEMDLPRAGNEIEFSEYTDRAHDKGYLFRMSKEALNKFADGQGFKLLASFPSGKFNREVLIYDRK